MYKDQAVFQTTNPALVIIDVDSAQPLPGKSLSPKSGIASNITNLLEHWQRRNLPVYHVRPPTNGDQAMSLVAESATCKPRLLGNNEHLLDKRDHSAFLGTSLRSSLKSKDTTEIVICGAYTNNAIDTTVRVAAEFGYTVYVPHDATSAQDLSLLTGKQATANDVHWMFLSNLDGDYCTVCRTEDLLG